MTPRAAECCGLLAVVVSLGAVPLRAQDEAGTRLGTAAPRIAFLQVTDGGAAEEAAAILAEVLERKRAKHARKIARFDKPNEALRFYLQKRLPPGTTELPVEKYFTAKEHIRGMRRWSSAAGRSVSAEEARSTDAAAAAGAPLPALGTWQPLGPGNVGGRTRGLAIHPTNPAVMYAGGVAGGVWKTTNGGASWTPLGDLLANIAVTTIALSPANADVIYVGTGEGFNNIDLVRGAGIFKSTDGGAHWSHLPATAGDPDFHFVNDLTVSATSAARIYAATSTGVWRSQDGGLTWSHRLAAPDCTALSPSPGSNPDVVFAACAGFFEPGAVHRTPDAGNTWTQVLTDPNMGRVSLAVAPSNPAVVYALAADLRGGSFEQPLLEVFRSTTGGGLGTWTGRVNHSVKLNRHLLTNTIFAHGSDCGFGADELFSQGAYDNVIAVDPVNSEIVWAGGIDLFRSNDGGANWGLASHWWLPQVPPWTADTRFAHADQHAIAFHPNYNGTSNQQMFVGNDGGIWRTTNARGATGLGDAAPCAPTSSAIFWQELNNNYGVTQFYHGIPYPDGTRYLGGTQDNGTVRGDNAGGHDGWAEILAGDGGAVAVDPTNTNRLYAENTGLSIKRSENGGASWAEAVAGIDPTEGWLFITPFVMDPNNPGILWTAAWSAWRTMTAAAGWSAGSDFLPGCCSASAIAVARGNSNKVVIGMQDGWIARSAAALASGSATVWAGVQPRMGWVSSVAFDPSDSNVVYATYATFGGGHVWKSLNGGQTFIDISGSGSTGLPDIPAHAIVVDPSDPATLFVGTDLGVFVSRDRGHTWFVEQTGFANVVVESMSVSTAGGAGSIYAFTHGRGAWRVPATTATGGTQAPLVASHISGATIDVRGFTVTWGSLVGVDLYDVIVTDLATGMAVFSGSTPSPTQFLTLPSGSYQLKVRGCVNVVSSATCGAFAVVTFQVDVDGPPADGDADGIPTFVEPLEGRNPSVKDNAVFTNARLFAMQQYRDFLGREGDPGGIGFWAGRIASGETRASVVENFFLSTEFQSTTAPATRLYLAFFLRIPDYGGLTYWTDELRRGVPLAVISESFALSAEFQQTYGSLGNADFVELVYNNVLGRASDPAGKAYWVGQLNAGLTRGAMMVSFSESAEYRGLVFNEVFVVQIYVGMLRRTPEPSGFDFWLAQLDGGASGRNLIQSFLGAPEYHDRFLP